MRRADRALAAAHANLHAGAFDAGAGDAGRGRGRRGQRPPAGPRGAAPWRDQPGLHLRQPRTGAAAPGRQAAGVTRSPARARDLPRRLGRSARRRSPRRVRRPPERCLRGCTLGPTGAGRCRARRPLLEGLATVVLDAPGGGGAESAAGRGRLRRWSDVRPTSGCTGVPSPRTQHSRCGTSTAGLRCQRPLRRARPCLRSAGPVGHRPERAPCRGHLVRGLRDRDLAGRGGAGRQGGDRGPTSLVRRPLPRRLPGSARAGDTAHHRGRRRSALTR